MAGAVLVTAPVVLVFAVAQRSFLQPFRSRAGSGAAGPAQDTREHCAYTRGYQPLLLEVVVCPRDRSSGEVEAMRSTGSESHRRVAASFLAAVMSVVTLGHADASGGARAAERRGDVRVLG